MNNQKRKYFNEVRRAELNNRLFKSVVRGLRLLNIHLIVLSENEVSKYHLIIL